MDREIDVSGELEKAEQEFDELVLELDGEEEQEDQRITKDDTQEDTEEETVQKKDRPKRKGDFQGRINQLTWKAREAERREQEALQRAELLEDRISQLEEQYSSNNVDMLKDKERTLKSARRQALENSDYDKLEEIDDELMEVKIQRRTQPVQRTPQTQGIEQPQTQVTPNDLFASEWLQSNEEWWFSDEGKRNIAMQIDANLKSEGFNPNTPSFWRELDERIDEYENGRQEQNVARRKSQNIVDSPGPAVKKSKGTVRFSLSPQEQAYARELGITKGSPAWDGYVKQVKAQRDRQNA